MIHTDDDGDERDDDISCTIYYIAPSSSNKPVPSAMKIEMIARSSAVTYTSVYANPSNSDYQSLAIDTCKQVSRLSLSLSLLTLSQLFLSLNSSDYLWSFVQPFGTLSAYN